MDRGNPLINSKENAITDDTEGVVDSWDPDEVDEATEDLEEEIETADESGTESKLH